MISTYFKTSWRILTKNKAFSFINIFGLAIGFTCFLFILAFVVDELKFDRYPADAENMYRVNLSVTGNGNIAVYPDVDVAVGEGMKNAIPEIKSFTRLLPTSDFVKYGAKEYKEEKLARADSNFFRLFSIPLLEGVGREALVQPNSIVISREFAKRYFGNEDPMGKPLVVGLHNAVYTVTGVYDAVPRNSHFHFDALLSLSTLRIVNGTWSNLGFYTYLELYPAVDPRIVEAKFPQLVKTHIVPEIQRDMGVSYADALKAVDTFRFSLVPLTDIHLESKTKYELEPNGDIQYVYIFSALALFILLLACVNFTNLSTASSERRAKEIGIRKVMGSDQAQLVKQLLAESVLLSFFAMVLAVIAVTEFLPYFNTLSGKHISVQFFFGYQVLLVELAFTLVVGLLAGVYPAFFLSGFNPIQTLKGKSGTKHGRSLLRGSLIVFQFVVSIGLIIATVIVYQQLVYMQQKNLGFNKDQVLFIPDGRLLGNNQTAFKERLLQDGRVLSASIARSIPGEPFMDGTEIYAKNDSSRGPEIHSNIYHVDMDYVRTLGITMVEGRYFSTDFPSDSAGVVVNQAAVRELGWSRTDPLGKTIVTSGQHAFRVIGVMADFNYLSVRQEIAPLMMVLGNNFGGLVVKARAADISGFLDDLKIRWDAFQPAGPLRYSFLDDKFAAMYSSEERTQQIFSVFALIAICIGALGLFGLSAFIIEQRTKEIGVRKVLGASVPTILLMLSKDFVKWVVLANLIAWPAAWYAMNIWLQDYAYRVHVSWWVFAASGALALLIALTTVSVQTFRAATANPVEALRYE